MGNFGIQEILLILLIVCVLFGARKIPELFKGIGEGVRELKKAAKAVEEEVDDAKNSVKTIADNDAENENSPDAKS